MFEWPNSLLHASATDATDTYLRADHCRPCSPDANHSPPGLNPTPAPLREAPGARSFLPTGTTSGGRLLFRHTAEVLVQLPAAAAAGAGTPPRSRFSTAAAVSGLPCSSVICAGVLGTVGVSVGAVNFRDESSNVALYLRASVCRFKGACMLASVEYNSHVVG